MTRSPRLCAFGLNLLILTTSAWADPSSTPILPPVPQWEGKSTSLMVDKDHPWVTPSEQSGLTETPRYEETVAWLEKLVAAAPELTMVSIGRSAEGREIWMVIANRHGAADPKSIRGGRRPVLLAHAGIHSGEIDGKDAGMMLLRDMTVTDSRKDLLDRASLLFIPILNVDGHERFSAFNRVNQRGPAEMGWRTNRRNLNLNRDYSKLETPALQALAEVVRQWQPDLYLDLHVTDGQDYQYDITYGYNGPHGWSPAIAGWLDQHYTPAVNQALADWGHIPGPLIFAVNDRDLSNGFVEWTAGPRYSNGWGDARHLPSVLLENHSLKPYRQRVLGTYVYLDASMRALGEHHEALRKAVDSDRQPRSEVPLGWAANTERTPEQVPFRGIRSEDFLSPISGSPTVRWTGEPDDSPVAVVVMDQATVSVRRPDAYYIPAAWAHLAEVLRRQGILVETLDEPTRMTLESYRLPEAALDASGTPFEGRMRFTAGTPKVASREVDLPAGSLRVPTAQDLGILAMLLLEPQSPDSLFQWGYLAEILQRTEYIEAYAMEPMAQAMLEADPDLQKAFEERLRSDPEFAADPRARLQWFYRRTPFHDQEHRLYPIFRSLD